MKKNRKPAQDILQLSGLLALAVLGCAALYGFRVLLSKRIYYLYLVQNIALAFVPYLIAAVAALILPRMKSGAFKTILLIVSALLWMAFYPNAPYIFTDFIHIVNKVYLKVAPALWPNLDALIWYDLIMTAAFAFVGHFIGLVSMWLVQNIMSSVWGKHITRWFLAFASVLAGFGVYLGRFSRLNSWDIVMDPKHVLGEVMEAATEPGCFFFTLVFALFILLSYAALSSFKKISPPARPIK